MEYKMPTGMEPMDGWKQFHIDWNDIHWGTFTKQWKRYRSKHKGPDTLDDFAHIVMSNPDKFQSITRQRAQFYLFVLKRHAPK